MMFKDQKKKNIKFEKFKIYLRVLVAWCCWILIYSTIIYIIYNGLIGPLFFIKALLYGLVFYIILRILKARKNSKQNGK